MVLGVVVGTLDDGEMLGPEVSGEIVGPVAQVQINKILENRRRKAEVWKASTTLNFLTQ